MAVGGESFGEVLAGGVTVGVLRSEVLRSAVLRSVQWHSVELLLAEWQSPEHNLQEREVFTPEEIRAIVARHRTSEYLLRRRHARQSDFIQYIQAETALERLRQLRVHRLKLEQRQNEMQLPQPNQEQTKHAGDKHMLQHLHLHPVRTLRKYRADVDLYLQYTAWFARCGSIGPTSICICNILPFARRIRVSSDSSPVTKRLCGIIRIKRCFGLRRPR